MEYFSCISKHIYDRRAFGAVMLLQNFYMLHTVQLSSLPTDRSRLFWHLEASRRALYPSFLGPPLGQSRLQPPIHWTCYVHALQLRGRIRCIVPFLEASLILQELRASGAIFMASALESVRLYHTWVSSSPFMRV